MKRKKIEKVAPVQPTKKRDWTVTAQTIDDILVFNVFKKGILIGRHAIKTECGEYSQYRTDTQEWKNWKFVSLLGIDTTPGGWYDYSKEKRMVFDTPEQEQMAKEVLETGKKIYRKYNVIELINEAEQEYNISKKRKTEKNRVRRVKDKMNLVPELPQGIREWIWQMEGAEDFAFYDKDKDEWTCTACAKSYPTKAFKVKKVLHNSRIVCPECGKDVTAKKRQKEIEKNTHFSISQKMEKGMSVARYFDAKIVWTSDALTIGTLRKVYINESVRFLMYHLCNEPKYVGELFYNQYSPNGAYSKGWDHEYSHFDNKSNPANRRIREGCMYPEGIEEALKGTAYENWGRIFTQMAAAGTYLNYNKLMASQNNTQLIGIAEYLFKGRFKRLLRETADGVSLWDLQYYGPLDIWGEDIEEIFDIPDKQMINRIRDVDGGVQTVRWMKWSCKEKQKIPQDVLEWLTENNIQQNDVEFIKDRMSLTQIMNYVKRQQSEGYKGRKAGQVLRQWDDYLGMLKNLGKKTDDPMMYRPRELKRRHDECVEEINRIRMIKELERSAEHRKAEADRMRKRFPGAEDVLKDIKGKYEFADENYLIMVPQDLIDIMAEGQALHHCAGATDRYFDRIMQRETYICFLRKVSSPDTPYYTIEVEPGGTIRQHRGMYDEEPELDKVKPFLREWQKVVRKRMSKHDHELAAVSKVKREENIADLKAKNNTRVLAGLMEDFMEAI